MNANGQRTGSTGTAGTGMNPSGNAQLGGTPSHLLKRSQSGGVGGNMLSAIKLRGVVLGGGSGIGGSNNTGNSANQLSSSTTSLGASSTTTTKTKLSLRFSTDALRRQKQEEEIKRQRLLLFAAQKSWDTARRRRAAHSTRAGMQAQQRILRRSKMQEIKTIELSMENIGKLLCIGGTKISPEQANAKLEQIDTMVQKEIMMLFTRLKKDVARSPLDGATRISAFLPFAEPVDWVKLGIPNYPTIVKEPMDFGTIEKRCQNGHYTAGKFERFERDMRLVFSNCLLFNKDPVADKYLRFCAMRMSAIFEKCCIQIREHVNLAKVTILEHHLMNCDIELFAKQLPNLELSRVSEKEKISNSHVDGENEEENPSIQPVYWDVI